MATTSASQRRRKEKVAYDAYLATCPSRIILQRIADKWVALVVCALGTGDMRYAQLSRQIAGVSQKMLTQTLRNLERDGLVTRDVQATVPVTVTYSLTTLGRELFEVLTGVKEWAEDRAPKVIAAREEYDSARAD